MKSVPWDRAALIESARQDLWRYLTPSADIERDVLVAAALLQMPPTEVRLLGAMQFLLSDELARMIDYLPFLLRRLATTTAHEEELATDRLRGPIQWAQTVPLRAATGSAAIFVTAPSRRAYQTPENELLVFLLDQVVSLGRLVGWDRTVAPSEAVWTAQERVAAAGRWNQSRMLATIERRPMDPRRLTRIRQGRARRRYDTVLSAWDRYTELVGRLDRTAVRDAVESYGLTTRSDPTIFELATLFTSLRELSTQGWNLSRLGLFAGGVRIRGDRGSDRLDIVYQATPRELSSVSVYGAVQVDHAIARGALRPDLVLRLRRGTTVRWILVEVKGGTRPVEESARAALYDLLAYRTAYAPLLNYSDAPYGLGVAWGANLEPQGDHGVMLCTPDTLHSAFAGLLD